MKTTCLIRSVLQASVSLILISSCSSGNPSKEAAKQSAVLYRGIEFNPDAKTVRIVAEEPEVVTEEYPGAGCRAAKLYDGGRQTDSVTFSTNDNKIQSRYEYKQLAETPEGKVVLEDGYDAGPQRTWDVSKEEVGEIGQPLADGVPADAKLEGVCFVYIYKSGDFLKVGYSPSGDVDKILLTIGKLKQHFANPQKDLVSYGLPVRILMDKIELPINESLLRGIKYRENGKEFVAPSTLDCAFLVKQYCLGTIFEVETRNSQNELIRKEVLKFARRPFANDKPEPL